MRNIFEGTVWKVGLPPSWRQSDAKAAQSTQTYLRFQKLWEGNLWQTGVAWKDVTRCGSAKNRVWHVWWELCFVSDLKPSDLPSLECGRLRSKEICIDSLWAKIQVEPSCEERAKGFELQSLAFCANSLRSCTVWKDLLKNIHEKKKKREKKSKTSSSSEL